MELHRTGTQAEPLRVGWMALALVVAAFLGASLGLVWQSAGWDAETPEAAPPPQD